MVLVDWQQLEELFIEVLSMMLVGIGWPATDLPKRIDPSPSSTNLLTAARRGRQLLRLIPSSSPPRQNLLVELYKPMRTVTR